MDAPTLAKYKRAFNLHGKTSSQEELADLVQRHYDSLEVNEKDAIVYFVYAVRNQGTLVEMEFSVLNLTVYGFQGNILKLPPQDIAGLRPSTEAPRD